MFYFFPSWRKLNVLFYFRSTFHKDQECSVKVTQASISGILFWPKEKLSGVLHSNKKGFVFFSWTFLWLFGSIFFFFFNIHKLGVFICTNQKILGTLVPNLLSSRVFFCVCGLFWGFVFHFVLLFKRWHSFLVLKLLTASTVTRLVFGQACCEGPRRVLCPLVHIPLP